MSGLSKVEKIEKRRRYFSLYKEEHICLHRNKANLNFITSLKTPSNSCLTPQEEHILVKMYELKLRDFLQVFRPKKENLPREVKGMSFHYLKRFYMVSSVMDYHPRDIMYACAFLACKNLDYNVPLDEFVKHIGGEPLLIKNIIIDCEEALLHRLNFLLVISTPQKHIELYVNKLEPYLRDLINPNQLYEHIHSFMSKMWFSDACLLFPPHKIALAAVLYATDSVQKNIDNIIVDTLLHKPSCPAPPPAEEHFNRIAIHMRNDYSGIRAMVTKEWTVLTEEELKNLELKLETCLNPHNNPYSDTYRKLLMERR